jgi:hypothetical protein
MTKFSWKFFNKFLKAQNTAMYHFLGGFCHRGIFSFFWPPQRITGFKPNDKHLKVKLSHTYVKSFHIFDTKTRFLPRTAEIYVLYIPFLKYLDYPLPISNYVHDSSSRLKSPYINDLQTVSLFLMVYMYCRCCCCSYWSTVSAGAPGCRRGELSQN